MSQSLVVVSNRLPFRATRQGHKIALERSPGGLVSALEPALAENGGVWIGWSGLSREELAASDGVTLPGSTHVRFVDVPLCARDVAEYYHAFANRTLWPLLHTFVGRTEMDAGTWKVYERVNERFAAETTKAVSDPDALIWIHDYHLLRAAHHVRQMRPGARTALFLHVPFPASDVFRVLPWSRELLRGMLGADYVGFHIRSYALHFLDCAEQLLGCTVDRSANTVRFDGRLVGVGVNPISIDVAEAETLAAAAEGSPRSDPSVKHILGVDRLDYTKGIVHRLEAIERFLERFAAYRRRVRFTQILVPSREQVRDYRELKRQIDETVGRINGRFSDERWTPIRYIARALSREELFAAYRHADVALVTPLRDGMNLVAKEYVMARTDGEGVLVLSELAGVADELQEAVTVTPFDVDAVADALHRALSMAPDERRARMLALRARVRGHDVHAWVRDFVRNAQCASDRARIHREAPVDEVRRRLAPWLAERDTLALLLDYDGTLTPIVDNPERARIADSVRATLEQARRNPNIDVMIVTGRGLEDIQRRVDIPDLTYIANHGFEVSAPGIEWRHPDGVDYVPAVARGAEELRGLEIANALVELKGTTVSYHYRQVAPEHQAAARRDAERILRRRKLRVTHGKLVVEGRPPVDWDKGAAALWALTHRHGSEWPSHVRALYLGDDATDEDAFRSLRGLGRSIRVAGSGAAATTLADFTVPDTDAVLDLLRWIAAGAFTTETA